MREIHTEITEPTNKLCPKGITTWLWGPGTRQCHSWGRRILLSEVKVCDVSRRQENPESRRWWVSEILTVGVPGAVGCTVTHRNAQIGALRDILLLTKGWIGAAMPTVLHAPPKRCSASLLPAAALCY